MQKPGYTSVLNQQDYYPFGMLQPGRQFSVSNYRFGFGGQEQDDDLQGKGQSYTAKFWEYDSRLGRRWNEDPKPLVTHSPYVCFMDNPIVYRDIKGDTSIFINGKTGSILSITYDKLPNRAYIIANPSADEVVALCNLKRSDANKAFYTILKLQSKNADELMVYDLDAPRRFFRENYRKTISNKDVDMEHKNESTGKWKKINNYYAEYAGSLVLKEGIVTVGPSKVPGGESSVNAAAVRGDVGYVADLHIHSQPRGEYRHGTLGWSGPFRDDGPSPEDYPVAGGKGNYFNIVADEKVIYLYHGHSQLGPENVTYNTITIPNDLSKTQTQQKP